MKFIAFATIAALAQSVVAYPITGDNVNCRTGPGTSYSIVLSYKKGVDVKVTCQTKGTNVSGNTIWDKTSDGCYVADYYVKTGSDGYVTTKCTNGPSPPDSEIPGPIIDDYPYKGKCHVGSESDQWRYFKCQCTSFVAWRINERLGINFHNRYLGAAWGNAKTWDDAARQTGVKVDNKPVPGSVAVSNRGASGHVAWVTGVSGDKVTIEEYNWNNVEAYSKRTVPKDDFTYVHIKV
jgi:surface antigen